jgi:peptidoglycan/LPS O-acetylase OafA/YrhL
MGMALFFTLSGFLIANFLLHQSSISDFLIRRLARIIPLAWAFLLVALPVAGASHEAWLPHLLFYANWPPMDLTSTTSHFWSLCVEMQFYLGIALLVLLFGKKGLLLVPAICIAITLYRVADGVHIAVNTYYRLDEILAGSILALTYHGRLGGRLRAVVERTNPYLIALLFIVSCHPDSGWVNYFRPYLAAMLVGWTLLNRDARISTLLDNRPLAYIAAISYALYVIHPIFNFTWLGSGEGWEKYIKRPLYFGAVFLLAHVSTFYYEQRCIKYAKRFSEKLRSRSARTV